MSEGAKAHVGQTVTYQPVNPRMTCTATIVSTAGNKLKMSDGEIICRGQILRIHVFLTMLLLLVGGGTAGADEFILIDCNSITCDAQPSHDELRLVEERYGVHGLIDPFNTPRKLMTDKLVPNSWAALTAAALLANQRKATTDCLAKMEAAMRAMDDFVVTGIWRREDGVPSEKKVRAYFQWRETKRDCWREP